MECATRCKQAKINGTESLVDQRLHRSEEPKSIRVSKRGSKTVEGESEGWGGRGACIAGQALIPPQTPMRPLCSGEHLLLARLGLFVRWRGPHRHHDRFGSHDFEPVASELTARPISPQDRVRWESRWQLGERRRRSEKWYRGSQLRGSDGPENRTDPPWFAGGKAFLTLGTHRTGATIADASGIQQTVRAIALRSAFLRVTRMIGGAE